MVAIISERYSIGGIPVNLRRGGNRQTILQKKPKRDSRAFFTSGHSPSRML
jgi:hypothetical protein